MPQIAFDLWTMTSYTTDAGKTYSNFPFRTKRATPTGAPGSGNDAVNAVSGTFGYNTRPADQPCVGSVECVTPRKLICVLSDGETLGVPVDSPANITAGVAQLKGAGCLCVHLEGERIIDPGTFMFP